MSIASLESTPPTEQSHVKLAMQANSQQLLQPLFVAHVPLELSPLHRPQPVLTALSAAIKMSMAKDSAPFALPVLILLPRPLLASCVSQENSRLHQSRACVALAQKENMLVHKVTRNVPTVLLVKLTITSSLQPVATVWLARLLLQLEHSHAQVAQKANTLVPMQVPASLALQANMLQVLVKLFVLSVRQENTLLVVLAPVLVALQVSSNLLTENLHVRTPPRAPIPSLELQLCRPAPRVPILMSTDKVFVLLVLLELISTSSDSKPVLAASLVNSLILLVVLLVMNVLMVCTVLQPLLDASSAPQESTPPQELQPVPLVVMVITNQNKRRTLVLAALVASSLKPLEILLTV